MEDIKPILRLIGSKSSKFQIDLDDFGRYNKDADDSLYGTTLFKLCLETCQTC